MEKNNFEISFMNEEDLKNIKENLIVDFDDFWNFSILKQEFEANNTLYIVAKLQNSIVGFAGIKIILDEANIMNIVTHKKYRNFGIASSMLDKLIKISKEKNLKSITLEVNEHNKYAIKLYEKFKFKTLGIRKKYYKNMDSAYIMTLFL